MQMSNGTQKSIALKIGRKILMAKRNYSKETSSGIKSKYFVLKITFLPIL